MSAHDIFTDTLRIMRGVMERDEYVDGLYDAAAEEDRRYDEWRQREDDEREMILEAALTEALDKGVSVESLRVLARECGAVSWALKNSLRGTNAAND